MCIRDRRWAAPPVTAHSDRPIQLDGPSTHRLQLLLGAAVPRRGPARARPVSVDTGGDPGQVRLALGRTTGSGGDRYALFDRAACDDEWTARSQRFPRGVIER